MSGGGGQMPMASNQGQQMQNPQIGMQPQGGMQGNPGFMPGGANQSAMPVGGMFGAQQQMNGLFGGQPQMAQQVPPQGMMGGMSPQAFDQFRQEEMLMGGMQPAMGIAALGSKPMQGAMGAPMDYATPRMQSDMNPYQQNPNQVDMRPTNMAGPGMGMPPGYRPTNGPIDGRHLRDMMDITRRRPMGMMGPRDRNEGGLPGSIGNDLPPSLKRPTQGDYKGFK